MLTRGYEGIRNSRPLKISTSNKVIINDRVLQNYGKVDTMDELAVGSHHYAQKIGSTRSFSH